MSETKSTPNPLPTIYMISDGSAIHSEAAQGLDEISSKGNAALCLQCYKCSAGCPVSSVMDFPPSRIVRLVQLGQKEILLASKSIWLCTSCYTCTSRCPAGVSPTALQDALRRLSAVEGRPPSDPRAAEAAEAFLWSVQKRGRTHELSLTRRFKLRTRTYLEMFFLGITLLLRGKLKVFGKKIRYPKTVAALAQKYLQRGPAKD